MIDLSAGVPGVDGPAPASFDEFWPFFLSQHLHPRTRVAHAAGLTMAVVGLAGVVARRSRRRWAVFGLAGGAAQLASHFVFEGNSPRDVDRLAATPWWIVRADVRMVADIYRRRIGRDVDVVRAALRLGAAQPTLAAARRRPAA
jgi:hypothetical protein